MFLDKMAEKLTDVSELQKYCNSQYELIIELSKKINNLETERNHLKNLLEQQKHLVIDPQKPSEVSDVTDEEIVCRMQIRMLKDVSNERDLTLEEAKRFEIFTKILNGIRSKEEKKSPTSGLKDEDLLSLVKE